MRRFGSSMVRLKPDPTIELVVEKYWRRREIGTEGAQLTRGLACQPKRGSN